MTPKRKSQIAFRAICLFCLICSIEVSFAQQVLVESGWWAPSRQVGDIQERNGEVYLAGEFFHLGTNNRSISRYQYPTTKSTQDNWYTNGIVKSIVSDGQGGVYIAGTFTKFGLTTRNRIARINSDGSLHSWNASFDSVVNVLKLVNGRLYVGGYFNQVNGQTRNYLAALDTATGLLLPFNPDPNWLIHDFEVWNNQLIVAGAFTEIGGQQRNRLAAFDLTTGALNNLSLNINNEVLTLKVANTNLLIGGMFSNIGSSIRRNFASINLLNSSVNPLSVNFNNFVFDIEFSNNRVFVGGSFDSVNNILNKALAVIDINSGSIINQNNNNFSLVNSISHNQNKLILSGSFNAATLDSLQFSSVTKEVYAIEINKNTLQITGWNTGWISKISLYTNYATTFVDSNGLVYVGGNFSSMGGELCRNVAKINFSQKSLTQFNVQQHSYGFVTNVDAISLITNDEIYLKSRLNFDALVLNNNTGVLSANPRYGTSYYGGIRSGEFLNGSVYVGGNFSAFAGIPRNFVASLDTLTGMPTSWAPNVNGFVRDVKRYNSTMLLAGEFTSVNGQARDRLAAVNSLTGALTSLNISFNGPIEELYLVDTVLYAIGSFTSVAGQPRQFFAAINLINNSLLPISFTFGNVSSQNNVLRLNSIAFKDNYIYLGGQFDLVNSLPRVSFAIFDRSNQQIINTGNQFVFQVVSENTDRVSINSLFIKNNKLFIGGNFEFIGDQYRPNFAVVSMPSILGIDEIENEAMTTIRTVDIYPNPANDQLFISIPAAGLWQTEIISLSGQVVDKLLLSQGTHSLPLNLDQGLYLIRFTDGKSTETRKLMINK